MKSYKFERYKHKMEVVFCHNFKWLIFTKRELTKNGTLNPGKNLYVIIIIEVRCWKESNDDFVIPVLIVLDDNLW